MAIESFSHKGLKRFFDTGTKAGIQPKHAVRLGRILDRLDSALAVEDMDFPGSDFHQLSGKLRDFYSVHVNGNYCVYFKFKNGNAYEVSYEDYH
ncbi:Endoribonuclease HigB [Chlamydiales bacterium SCGC AG-110-M15]|nr:Endoribonuclease HigB [Chlamydiales bacterium SCGC AG-110-M15]